MDQLRQPGAHCALRFIVNNRVWLAQSVTVVKDEPGETALLLIPGAQCIYPEGYWRWKRGDYSQGTPYEEMRKDHFALRELTWQTNRLLMLLEPDTYYATFLFWDDATGHFNCYYVNFQIPFRRSLCGFDSRDLDIDLVANPDGAWHWKDEAEYQESIRSGLFSAEWASNVEKARPQVLNRIRERHYPFDHSWLSWKPDPAWLPPRLPEHYMDV
jgi:hypothetical protein